MKPSSTLIAAIKDSPLQQYKIALQAGLHPDTLSKLVNGAIPVYQDDRRILAVAKVVGVPPEACFEKDKAVAS